MKEQVYKLQNDLATLERGLAIVETDIKGNILRVNRDFSEWTGYSPEEIEGQKIYKLFENLSSMPALAEHIKMYSKLTTELELKTKDNRIKLPVAVTACFEAGDLVKFVFKMFPINTQTFGGGSGDVGELKRELQEIEKKYSEVREQLERYIQAERRLKRQQLALRSLTNDEHLRSGNLVLALKDITEIAGRTLNADRVGLWIKDEGNALVSVDIYEKETGHISPDWTLSAEKYKNVIAYLNGQRFLVAENGSLEKVYDFSWMYSKENKLLMVSVFLEDEPVGVLTAERKEDWFIDEENFLIAVADVTALALEQGNKKEIEEELRKALSASISMEEELRQNMEELESINEQMLETQIELKGRIQALNNTAYVIETTPQGEIIYVNEELLPLFGEDEKNILHKNIFELLEIEKERERKKLNDAFASARIWKGEAQLKTYEGEVWLNLSLTPVRDEEDKLIKFIWVGVNISKQKRQAERIKKSLEVAKKQEEELQLSRQVLEKANMELQLIQQELLARIRALESSAYVYETDIYGNIIYVSDSLLEVTGYARDELIGKNFTILRSGRQDEKLYKEQEEVLPQGKIWTGELEKRTKDGEYFWVKATKVPVVDHEGKPLKIISVLFDITEQKSQEFRLKKQQKALLQLNKHPDIVSTADMQKSFRTIAEIGRETLEADRISIWIFDEDNPDVLKCVAVSQSPLLEHIYEEGALLRREKYPKFFDYIEKNRFISTDDVYSHPITKEFASDIEADKAKIAEMDVSILLGSQIEGILSVERRTKPTPWTLDEETFATSLADIAGLVLEQRELQLTEELKAAYKRLEEMNREVLEQKKEIEETHRFLTESLRYAKRIQRNLLPDKATMKKYLKNYFITFKPKDVVGGDFYWLHVDGTKRIIVIADGTGHGVPGAFITVIGYMLLNQIVVGQKIYKPADILYHLHVGVRKALKQDQEDSKSLDGMDVAICLYDEETRKAQYAGANLPFYYYQNWDIHKIKPDKKSIGGEQMEEERIFTNHEIQLYPGDAIYMYTDGFVDQLGGPEKKRFGTRRFKDLILRTQHESMDVQRAQLNFEWKEWKGDDEQLDDVTVFGMKIL